MQSVNSFDIFDTLLARIVLHPEDIFDIVEKKYKYHDFKKQRIKSQQLSNGTFDDIYAKFKCISNLNDEQIEKIKNDEILTEIECTIPIMSNINKIQNNDLLVSDMYFSNDVIMKILKFHNINTNINLFVTSNGKHNGTMWENLITKFNIKNHIGDNVHSDINMAKKYNINATLTNIHKFSEIEKMTITKYPNFCNMLRIFRLKNPYDERSNEYKLYEQQIIYNIPLLIFMCYKLKYILETENRNTVLFLTRYGCHIIKIFKTLFPKYNAVNLHSSRAINTYFNEDYCKYIKQNYDDEKCIIFDLHGSFNSGRKLFMQIFNCLPRIFIFDLSLLSNVYDKMTYISNKSFMLEYLNIDLVGTLINFEDNIDIRLPLEYNKYNVEIMHKTVDSFVMYLQNHINIQIIDEHIFNDDNIFIKLHDILYDIFVKFNKFECISVIRLDDLNVLNENINDKCNVVMFEKIIDDIVNKQNNKINLLDINNMNDANKILNHMNEWSMYFYNYGNFTFFNNTNVKLIFNTNIKFKYIIEINQKSSYNFIVHNNFDSMTLFYKLFDLLDVNGYYIIDNTQNKFIHNNNNNNFIIVYNNKTLIIIKKIKCNNIININNNAMKIYDIKLPIIYFFIVKSFNHIASTIFLLQMLYYQEILNKYNIQTCFLYYEDINISTITFKNNDVLFVQTFYIHFFFDIAKIIYKLVIKCPNVIILSIENIYIHDFNKSFNLKHRNIKYVFDYKHYNMENIIDNKKYIYCPMLYSKYNELMFNEYIFNDFDKNIDVLFYGKVTKRRNEYINLLKNKFNVFVVEYFSNLYEQNNYLLRTKICLCIHSYEQNNCIDYFRLSTLISNKHFLMHEYVENNELYDVFNNNIITFTYNDVMDKCELYLNKTQNERDMYANKLYDYYVNICNETQFPINKILKLIKK
jgi:hypothetical protein